MKKFAICTIILFAAAFCAAQQLDQQPAHEKGGSISKCQIDLSQTVSSWRVDFRSCDLSKQDLNELDQETVMSYLTFDDTTIWPKGKKLPKWLKPLEIMRLGKTPGLNIKELHARGITGKGIGIAIIDGALPKHAEYQDRLLFYKHYDNPESLMHGAAVASIAAGKTVGVAPGAYLYYFSANVANYIDVIYEILELNKTLAADKKIAVISISYGGMDEEARAKVIKEAELQNIVIFDTTNTPYILSRDNYMADIDDIASYNLWPYWWTPEEAAWGYAEVLCVPAGFRILASPTGYENYVAYGGSGSMSWAVPYYAGLYALAKQVYPALDKETFDQAARGTAHNKKIKDEKTGAEIEVKYFINPVGLIQYLQNKSSGGKAPSKSEGDKKKKASIKGEQPSEQILGSVLQIRGEWSF